MQQLDVVARLFPLVLSGEKTSTIRWREARIAPGFMTYLCEGEPEKRAVVWVTRCTDMPLSEVAAFLDKRDEWPDDVMLEGMRAHYPEIAPSDVVQVVEHLSPDETLRLKGPPAEAKS